MSTISTLSKTEGNEEANKLALRPALSDWTIRVILTEFLIIAVTAFAASALYQKVVYGSVFRGEVYIPFSIFLASVYILLCLIDDQYILAGNKWQQDGATRAVGALGLAFTFFLSVIFIFDLHTYFSRGAFLLQVIFTFSAIVVVRVGLVQFLERQVRSGRLRGRKLIVISLSKGCELADYSSRLSSKSDEIIGWYDLPSYNSQQPQKKPDVSPAKTLARIRAECRKADPDLIVVIYDENKKTGTEKIVRALYELPVQIRLLPVALLPFMRGSRVVETGMFTTLEVSTHSQSLLGRFSKRALDLTGALFAVVLFSPVFLITAIAIKLDSPGPILFRQTRHGYNNKSIQVLKFRTMKTPKNHETFRQTSKHDSRVTRIGHVLRKTNIDELPQLFNVIHGEMSLVGPRPHATEHNEAFADRVAMMYRRHNVKPGITGWAQVNGLRGATDTCAQMRKRIDYDLYYVDNWSFFFDIKILILTFLSKKAFTNAY